MCFQTIEAQVHVGTYSPSSKLTSSESRMLWLWILVRQDYGCQYPVLRLKNWSEGVAATPSGRNFRHPYRTRNSIYPHSNSPLALFQKGIAATAPLNASDMEAGAIFLVRSWFVDRLRSNFYIPRPSLHSRLCFERFISGASALLRAT